MSVKKCLTLIVSCIVLCGCGADDGNRRPTAPVTVTINYKGKPVEGAIVQFVSVENPQPSVGTTDASGSCSLFTYEANDGAIIGKNSVMVNKNQMDTKNAKHVNPADADLIGVTPPPILKSLLPKKYASPTTSGLTAEVAKGINKFTFELVD